VTVGIGPEFRRAADEYLRECARRSYSENTRRVYGRELLRFLVWLAQAHPSVRKPEDVEKGMIAEYQMALYRAKTKRRKKIKRLSVKTQFLRIGVVVWFFRRLVETERLLVDPSAAIVLPRIPQRLPHGTLSARQANKLLSSCNLKTHLGLRDRAVLETLYCSGLRATECRKLAEGDIDFAEGWITVRHGKGGKERIVPLGKGAAYYLSEYLQKSRPALLGEKTHDFVFVTRYGAPLSYDALNMLVARAARTAGLRPGLTPHGLRHTCATVMLKGGADIRHIQELLGHSSLTSTQIYTKVEISDLKKVHARCHPREKGAIEATVCRKQPKVS
jgi:integrase/recombinase XerD